MPSKALALRQEIFLESTSMEFREDRRSLHFDSGNGVWSNKGISFRVAFTIGPRLGVLTHPTCRPRTGGLSQYVRAQSVAYCLLLAVAPTTGCERSLDILVARAPEPARATFNIQYPRVLFSHIILEGLIVRPCGGQADSFRNQWAIEQIPGTPPPGGIASIPYGDPPNGYRVVADAKTLQRGHCYEVIALASHGATGLRQFWIDSSGAVK